MGADFNERWFTDPSSVTACGAESAITCESCFDASVTLSNNFCYTFVPSPIQHNTEQPT